MKAIILCAGYGTRLYPLTRNKPKPLLPIKGRPILDYLIEKVIEVKEVNEIFVVSNGKFYQNFLEYITSKSFSKPVKIINDNIFTNDSRLGGIGNLWLAIEQEKIDEDILVILGDNLFDFKLECLNNLFKDVNACVIGLADVGNLEDANKFGVVGIKDDKIVSFEEKPEKPKSTFVSTGIYFIPKEKIKTIKDYLNYGFSKEGIGYFIEWLLKKEGVYALALKGEWYDIGSKETYEKVNKEWGNE